MQDCIKYFGCCYDAYIYIDECSTFLLQLSFVLFLNRILYKFFIVCVNFQFTLFSRATILFPCTCFFSREPVCRPPPPLSFSQFNESWGSIRGSALSTHTPAPLACDTLQGRLLNYPLVCPAKLDHSFVLRWRALLFRTMLS